MSKAARYIDIAIDELGRFRRGPVPRLTTDRIIRRLKDLPADGWSVGTVRELQEIKDCIRQAVMRAAVNGAYEQTLAHGECAVQAVAVAENIVIRQIKR